MREIVKEEDSKRRTYLPSSDFLKLQSSKDELDWMELEAIKVIILILNGFNIGNR